MSGRSAGQLCCVHVSGVGWCISLDVPMLGARGSFHREPGLLLTTCISFECPARGVGMPVKIFAACPGLVVWDGMGRVLCTCSACPCLGGALSGCCWLLPMHLSVLPWTAVVLQGVGRASC